MRRPTIRFAVTVHSAIVFVAGVTLGAAGFALATPVGPAVAPRVAVVSAVKIDEEILGEPATATTFEVTFAPGAAGAPHRHPGPIFGYVLEGDFEFAVGDAPVRTLKAGETFYEPATALHRVSRNPVDKSDTRVLAVLIHPRTAKQLVIPAAPESVSPKRAP